MPTYIFFRPLFASLSEEDVFVAKLCDFRFSGFNQPSGNVVQIKIIKVNPP